MYDIYVPLFYRKKCVSRANSTQESVHMSRRALAFLAPITRALPSSATGRKTEEAKIEMRQQQLSAVAGWGGGVTRSQIEKRLDGGKGACRLRSGIPQILVHSPREEKEILFSAAAAEKLL